MNGIYIIRHVSNDCASGVANYINLLQFEVLFVCFTYTNSLRYFQTEENIIYRTVQRNYKILYRIFSYYR